MSIISISEIFQKAQKISRLKKIQVSGWVKSVRKSKKITFITLNDGSILKSLQITIPRKNFLESDLLNKINFGSNLLVNGKLVLDSERQQTCELQVTKIATVNSTDTDYPLQKKYIPLEVVRKFPHLRAKTNYFLAIFRLRHSISKAIHDFFHQEGFYYIPTPIITSNDTEGAGELFNINTNEKEPFFPKPAKLTVSGQLHAEALVQGLGKVYTFSPCFRAEKSHTTRHLAEFWMIEAEMAPTDLATTLKLTERLIRFITNFILEKCTQELEYLEKYTEQKIIGKLQKMVKGEFIQLTYQHAIKILKKEFREIK